MPPKRKKSSFENFLEAHEQDHVQQPSEISFAVLQEAYAQALTPLQPACKREKAERETKQQENNLKDRHNGSFKRVDASDDEVQIVHPGKKGVSSSAGSGSGILACNGKNCEHRAACLNWSGGLEDWGDEHKSFRRYCRRLGLEPDPSTSTRDPNLPVGLKNLGATCYANSYLQVWFQNMAFRHAVYQCSPVASTSQTKIEDTPLFQLQVTFTALQQGPTSVFNPQPLVRSLKLAETEQQDSSECTSFIDFRRHTDFPYHTFRQSGSFSWVYLTTSSPSNLSPGCGKLSATCSRERWSTELNVMAAKASRSVVTSSTNLRFPSSPTAFSKNALALFWRLNVLMVRISTQGSFDHVPPNS